MNLNTLFTKVSTISITSYIIAGQVFAANPDPGDAVRTTGKAIGAGVVRVSDTDVTGEVELKTGYARDFGSLITSLLTFVMLIAALMVLVYLIWGGIQWVTSGGDSGKTEEARNKITAAVVGLIILSAAWAIFLIVLKFLGFGSYGSLFTNIEALGGTTSTTFR